MNNTIREDIRFSDCSSSCIACDNTRTCGASPFPSPSHQDKAQMFPGLQWRKNRPHSHGAAGFGGRVACGTCIINLATC